ncbi:hypothetical protein H9L25_00575 [Terrisporobacter mayombei]|nr:hypothetical protein [Terrisporobacter mayombei]
MKTRMYYFKEVLHDDNVFVIYRHEQDVFVVFLLGLHNEVFGFHTLKVVYNTKQCRDIIKNYKEYI